jgi:hypothetical protein
MTNYITCNNCGGSGSTCAPFNCGECGGSGQITDDTGTTISCTCGGVQQIPEQCSICAGIGVVPVAAECRENVSPAVVVDPDRPVPPASLPGTMVGLVVGMFLLPFRCFPLGLILVFALLPEGCRSQVGEYLEKNSPPPKPRVLHPENPALRSYP